MLDGQKRIDEGGITLAVNECDGIRNPSQIFLSRRESLGRANALLCQKLPVQPSHIFLSHSVGIHKRTWLATASGLKTCIADGSALLRIRHFADDRASPPHCSPPLLVAGSTALVLFDPDGFRNLLLSESTISQAPRSRLAYEVANRVALTMPHV